MSEKIIPIDLALPLGVGSVNCFLVDTGAGFILVDAGIAARRAELEHRLVNAGVRPGNLRLILITHGDFDHTGNAAYLRDKFGALVAMHRGDAGMAERGDMFWNRKSGGRLIRLFARLLVRLAEADRFSPDVLLEEGQDLSVYGWQARILSLPGHSCGSIGVLTAAGELICGDLLENTRTPGLNSIMDDMEEARSSLERLRGMGVGTVYPGHGRPFRLEQLG
jgi:glyoxylase-like metal-dependent hydrolase (beta-lactamase superfamily II)